VAHLPRDDRARRPRDVGIGGRLGDERHGRHDGGQRRSQLVREHRELAPPAPLALVDHRVLERQRELMGGHAQQHFAVRGRPRVQRVHDAERATGKAERLTALDGRGEDGLAHGERPAASDDTLRRRFAQLHGQRHRAERVGEARKQQVEQRARSDLRREPVDGRVDALELRGAARHAAPGLLRLVDLGHEPRDEAPVRRLDAGGRRELREAAEQAAHLVREARGVDRRVDVRVATGDGNPLTVRRAGGQAHDRRRGERGMGAKHARDGGPVGVRQADVQKDQRWAIAERDLHAVQAVAGLEDGVPGLFEGVADGDAVLRVAFDAQDRAWDHDAICPSGPRTSGTGPRPVARKAAGAMP